VKGWWQVIFPGLFITLSVMSFNLFGDGLRDAMDPRHQVKGRPGHRFTMRVASTPPGWTIQPDPYYAIGDWGATVDSARSAYLQLASNALHERYKRPFGWKQGDG